MQYSRDEIVKLALIPLAGEAASVVFHSVWNLSGCWRE